MLALFLAIVWFAITIDDGPTTDVCTQLNAARESLKLAGWSGVDLFYEANCEPEQDHSFDDVYCGRAAQDSAGIRWRCDLRTLEVRAERLG